MYPRPTPLQAHRFPSEPHVPLRRLPLSAPGRLGSMQREPQPCSAPQCARLGLSSGEWHGTR